MKGKRSISFLITGMVALTNILGSASTVFAKESTNYEITTNNYETKDLVQHVNPLIGTNNFKGNSEWSGTAPLVSAPFGMTNFTPQTRENRIGDISYEYKDTKFKGFFATHQPAIWMGDYGYVNVMPQIGNVSPDQNGRALTFSHDDETSTPYYYKVTAGKEEGKPITSEMTATERCAIYRFTYPSSDEAKIFVESARGRGNGHIEIDEENGEITGWNNDNMSSHLNNNPPENLKGYFVIQFNKDTNDKGTYENYEIQSDVTSADGQKSGAYLSFNTEQDETVEIRIGTSFISVDQARANIEQEIGDKEFNEVKEETKNVWNDRLNAIQIEGATESENHIFYTAMYHALLYPRSFYEEVDGKYMYFSPYDDQYHEGKSYTDFSLWDTFRAQNSLLTIVAPDKIDEMVQSLLQNYQEGGYMPKWPNPGYTNIMIGTHADSIVAEAINKGFDGFDYNLAYEAVLKDAMVPQEGDGTIYKWGDRATNVPYEARAGLSAYKALGYIPNGYVNENVSRTIEFSYDDWCVAQVAMAVGEDAEAKFFLNRSMNYKNAINPETGYAMGRDVDGNWSTSGEHFTEGDRRKYTWFAPHDPQGLLEYMTEHQGADFYNTELEKAFGGLGGDKWIEQQNEPCHHYAYMFDFSGRPDLTQKYARQTLLESYFDDTSGQLGNDDCGQMSAWYVFSSMGFYPVNPASGEYMIGSPIFDKVTINNPKTDTQFVITANNNDDNETNANCYIQDATLNGEALNIPVITYDQITSGGNVEFNMDDTPSSWASDYHKEAIQYDEDAQSPEDDSKPPFFGNSEVTRVTGKNYASEAKVSATDYAQPGGDIDVPSISLIDGNYDTGYTSANVHSNEDLANTPYYLTMEWDNPLSRVTSFKIWSNYRGSQNPTKMDIEIKDSSSDQWKVIVEDWTPEWKDESGGDNRCSANIKFDETLKDITGLRIRIKEANFTWGKIAVRELEVFEDYSQKIEISNPSDYVANIKYNRNTLEKVLFNGKELVENEDYAFSGENNNQITVFGTSLVKDGADSGAKLEFVFSQGDSYVETLIIWDGWKAHLESLVEKAEAIDTSIYTSASVDNLNEAINEAKSIIDKEDASDEELEAASNKLNEAIEGLVVDTFRGSIMNDPSLKVSANGYVNENEAPEKAIDFDLNTKWSCRYQYADDGKFWMEMDFDKKYAVNGLIFIGAATENPSYLTKEFSLQIKEGNEWKDVYTLKDIEENEVKVTLDEPVMASQFRLVIPKLSDTDSANARVYEFHLLGNVLADKTALQIALDLANAITDEDLKDVIPVVADEFKAARDEANAIYNDTSATQEEVNNAFDRLASAMHMLDFKQGDKTALKAFIDKVTGLDSSKYTESTWLAFDKELTEANAVYNDENAMQEEVNTAYNELVTAFLNLRLIPDKSLLEDLINHAEGLTSANYTKATFDGLTKALNEAKVVFENPNATQKEVDSAKATLEKAINSLEANTPVDNTTNIPVNNGDTTASVKTGDESLTGMFATIALLSVAGYAALRRKD